MELSEKNFISKKGQWLKSELGFNKSFVGSEKIFNLRGEQLPMNIIFLSLKFSSNISNEYYNIQLVTNTDSVWYHLYS